MSNVKQLRPIHANSEANDGPSDTPWTPEQNADYARCRAETVARAMARHAAAPKSEAWSDQKRAAVPSIAEWNALTQEQKQDRYGAQANGTPTPKRDAYQRALADAVKALTLAAALNPNQEHGLMLILTDVKNLAA